MVLLRLFGGLSVEGGRGALPTRAAQRHRLALLALLAEAQPAGMSRDKLIACLWPESDERRARNLLNQSVHALRTAFGADALRSSGDTLELTAEAVTSDLRRFEDAVAAGRLREAADLYGGPFLDGFYLSGSVEFERWMDAVRERCRRAYVALLERLAAEAWAVGDASGAADWWRRAATEDPLGTRITLRLMEALEASGDRAGALRQAQVHAALLRDELQAEPDATVLALAERMRSEPAVHTPGAQIPIGPVAAPVPDTRIPAISSPSRANRVRLGRAVAVAAMLLVVAAGWSVMKPSAARPEARRLAVLPLANLTGDSSRENFVAGVHDALIAELGQNTDLAVLSRQSTLQFKGSVLPPPAIARQLDAGFLVEGSVFVAGDSVRVTVQLIRARDGDLLWSGTHDGRLGEALALQRDVARSIGRAVHARLSRVPERRAVDPRAQAAYLNGLFHLERVQYSLSLSQDVRAEAQKEAVREFEAAVALDSGWAAARAKLAQAYSLLAVKPAGRIRAEYIQKAKASAERALELDETESRAHGILGMLRLHHDRDLAGAERAVKRALELDPNSHHWLYAHVLLAAQRNDEAIVQLRLAQERNPLSESLQWQTIEALQCANRLEDALAEAEKLEARLGGRVRAARAGLAANRAVAPFIAQILSRLGRHEEAVAVAEEHVALTDSLGAAVIGLAYIYARAGRLDEARRLSEDVERKARAAGRYFRPAALYAALGDTERALDMVEESVAQRQTAYWHLRCTETYRLLRDEPRMQAVARGLGIGQ